MNKLSSIHTSLSAVGFALLIWMMQLGLSGCTHNNGDIGPWFGAWVIDAIEINGQPDTSYDRNVFWSFQNEVIKISVQYPHGVVSDHFGSWKEKGKILQLNYTHTDDVSQSYPERYAIPPVLHLPARGIIDLDIESMNGSHIVLTYTPDSGNSMKYTLKKLF
ncbi:MAG: lipocalin family protein [Bacteroidales bacterium]|nr:lipocalin family protein [Bacteroidales bacterium]